MLREESKKGTNSSSCS